MLLDLLGIEYIIIPIEHGFICVLQQFEELVFYFIQYIKTDEYIFVILEPVSIELLDDITVEHTFVGNA